jgi:hypothetical protein
MAKIKTTTAANTPSISPFRVKGLGRSRDTTLGWVEREYSQLAAWRILAVEWLKGETRGVGNRLNALIAFLERYLIQQKLPLDPAVLLSRSTILPDFYQTACPKSVEGIKYNNQIHAFLHFVLLLKFSEVSDGGKPEISPAFYNPVPRLSNAGVRTMRSESVHSPLPYGYIEELRHMLAAGPHFCNWLWAQSALGVEIGRVGRRGPDWYEVTEDQIDRSDPDCVWRETSIKDGTRFEMWSPIRWVALLVKLILPLRTFQVRMLDSGEGDTWRYSATSWTLNSSRLAQGSEQRPQQKGVFRRSNPLADGQATSTVLYINTNKTSDIAKSGPEKGYNLPWPIGGPMHQDVFYWLEKLRNWQERYNPILHPTPWAELDGRYFKVKSQVQLAGYADTCFLFRMPEADNEGYLPLKEMSLGPSWFRLLQALELRLAERCETHRNGTPIRFLPPQEEQNNGATTLFPLHSLRVSLITALALEGQVPFPILQKLAGHSRLLMTLYYIKPGATHIRDVLLDAAEHLEANKEASIQSFLLNNEHQELLQKAICNNVPSLAAAIPLHPAARNPVGWMPMHHGLCLVGGNTSEVEDNGAIGECYNGGPNIGSLKDPKYKPVPGGSRNCVRCRWFVTEPHHLPALVAHFNSLAYHFDEARNACLAHESELQDLKKMKADAENSGQPFARMSDYRQTERVWERAMKCFSDLAEDMVACWRLIERCKDALEAPQGDGTQLVAAGTIDEVRIAFEETESELLQLAGVCESVEIYPDLDPGKAVFRRSQLLDAILYRDDLTPVFMLLGEEDQLLVGNAFLRRLAKQMKPDNPTLGKREVIRLMDAGMSLSQHFDMDLSSLLPESNQTQKQSIQHNAVTGRK